MNTVGLDPAQYGSGPVPAEPGLPVTHGPLGWNADSILLGSSNTITPPRYLARPARNAALAWSQDAYAPLVTEGPAIDAIRARLAAMAVTLGHPRQIEQVVEVRGAGVHQVPLDRGVTLVRLVSPTFQAEGDLRRLGVAIAEIRLDGVVVMLTDPRLQQGFHAMEHANGLRWTDGHASIVLDPAPAVRALRLRVVAAGSHAP